MSQKVADFKERFNRHSGTHLTVPKVDKIFSSVRKIHFASRNMEGLVGRVGLQCKIDAFEKI